MGPDLTGIPWPRSLQARMAVIFFLIILLAMVVVGNYLSRSLERYYLQQHRDWLRQVAETVAGFTGDPLERLAADPQAPGQIESIEKIVGIYSGQDVELSVLDLQGVVISSTSYGLVGTRLADPQVRRALDGLPPAGELRTDPETARRKIYLAAPVSAGGRVVGAVFLAGSLERVDTTLRGVRAILLTATLLALVIAAGVSLLLARTITGPIHELTARAVELAGGRFDRLLEVRSGDEVGRLAETFNHLTVRLRETLDEISAEKQKAEAILTHMTDGIVAVDGAGRVILANPAAARLLGVAQDRLVGRPLLEAVPGLPLEEPLTAALRGEGAGREGDGPGAGKPLLVRAGELVLTADLAPLRDKAGRITGVVVVLHDVTGQERLEALRREFVANVSHELRTPLTTIKSYVETILDGAVDDPQVAEGFLRVVAGEVDRMTRLVSDLLTLSHLDSGRMRLELQSLDPNELVRSVAGKFEERCRRKDIELVVRPAGGLPPVDGDRDRLEQVLANLIANAIDFTPPGGRIEVATGLAPEGVTVTVRDTGVGIPAEDLPRVFERFYRVDKARSREYGGTGLGLSIARELTEAHGGRISIDSAPGRGTEVRVTLPAGDALAREA